MKIERKVELENNKDVDALERLINIAFNNSHQCKYVRDFLLHLYNQKKPVDLVVILQAVDANITQDCLAVIDMRVREMQSRLTSCACRYQTFPTTHKVSLSLVISA